MREQGEPHEVWGRRRTVCDRPHHRVGGTAVRLLEALDLLEGAMATVNVAAAGVINVVAIIYEWKCQVFTRIHSTAAVGVRDGPKVPVAPVGDDVAIDVESADLFVDVEKLGFCDIAAVQRPKAILDADVVIA